MAIQLLKQYPELAIYRFKNDEHTPWNSGFYGKDDENVLWSGDFINIKSMKTYYNSISNVSIRYIDRLGRCSETVIYRYNTWWFIDTAKKQYCVDTLRRSFIDAKPMKTYLNSRRTSSPST